MCYGLGFAILRAISLGSYPPSPSTHTDDQICAFVGLAASIATIILVALRFSA